MPKVCDVLRVLEEIAPSRHALSFDHIGLQVGDADAELSSGIVSLDWSKGLFHLAESRGAKVIVAHHPLIWDPLESVVSTHAKGQAILRLAKSGISYIACHTNWDAAVGGVNDTLAGLLGLTDAVPFGVVAESSYVKVVTFAPQEAAQGIIDAMSAAGAGVIGLYERCAFSSDGVGSFVGKEGSNPTIGAAGRVEETPEVRIEMRVPASAASMVGSALRAAHPYEEPPCDVYPLRESPELPLGRVGRLAPPLTLAELIVMANQRLGTHCMAWGDPKRMVEKLAVVGGSADDEWKAARDAGADAFLTGEVRQHVAQEACEAGFAFLAAGHYATEQPGCASLREALRAALPDVEWALYEPVEGAWGRPLSS